MAGPVVGRPNPSPRLHSVLRNGRKCRNPQSDHWGRRQSRLHRSRPKLAAFSLIDFVLLFAGSGTHYIFSLTAYNEAEGEDRSYYFICNNFLIKIWLIKSSGGPSGDHKNPFWWRIGRDFWTSRTLRPADPANGEQGTTASELGLERWLRYRWQPSFFCE